MKNRTPAPGGMFTLGNGVSTCLPFLLITLLLFYWGVVLSLADAWPSAVGSAVGLSGFGSSFGQAVFCVSCLGFALPAALFNRRFRYRRGLALGVALCIVGWLLLYPAARLGGRWLYAAALCVLAVAGTVLETSANPYLLSLGSPQTAVRRLNLAQAFAPVGVVTGLWLGRLFAPGNPHAGELPVAGMEGEVQARAFAEGLRTMTFVGVALSLAVLFAAIRFVGMPRIGENAHPGQSPSAGDSLRRLTDNRRYVTGVAAQFLCVGAQAGVWGYMMRMAMEQTGRDLSGAALYGLLAMAAFLIARFGFAALMRRVRPEVLLCYVSIAAVCLTGLAMFSAGMIAVTALIAVSACMSPMSPTVYGLACEGLSAEDTKIGAAGLVMALAGAGAMPVLQGVISAQTGSVGYSFVVPAFCFAFVGCYGWYAARLSERGGRR